MGKAIEPYVKELNPLIQDSLEICDQHQPIEELNEEYLQHFDVIIASASQLSIEESVRISSISSKYNNYFVLVDTFGYNGCCVIDLGSKDRVYRKEIGKDKLSDPIKIGEKGYVSLKDIFDRNVKDALGRWDKLYPPKIWLEYRLILQYHGNGNGNGNESFVEYSKSYLKSKEFNMKHLHEYYGPTEEDVNHGLATLGSVYKAQVSPVCSVLGGVVGNEVIKILSGKGEPANNLLLFDGLAGSCREFFVR